MARMNRPAPVEVSYKNMRFLITHNPTNATLSTFIQDWPFDDGAPPPGKVVEDWLSLLKAKFCDDPGSCVAVHCVAGLGRAPVLVALALIESGMKYEDAIQFIRQPHLRGPPGAHGLGVGWHPGSDVEPSTVNSSPTWKNTGPNRDCGSETLTRTRPDAVSCSSGPQPPARGARPAGASRPPGLHLAFLPSAVHLPPGVQLLSRALCCHCLPPCVSVCPRLPLFRLILPFVPMPQVSVTVPCVCLSEASWGPRLWPPCHHPVCTTPGNSPVWPIC
ncbi:protein tyrosine phosphatase type IVA 3 isoform 2-T4 [Hipposideros larvatus]